MKIALEHPISYGEVVDGKNVVTTYSPGEHDLPEKLACHFLSLKDKSTGKRIAHVPENIK